MRTKQPRSFTRCGKHANVWQMLGQWYQTQLGSKVEATEKELVHMLLSNLFGYQLLHVGSVEQVEFLANSRISHRMVMDICHNTPTSTNSCFYGQPQAMPVCTDSLDVVLLPHILEFSEQPHNVLREVERTLVPEGHVVILGFNPFSLWSLWRWLIGWRGRIPWCGHFITTTRIKDWLSLLGFDVIERRYYFFRPPFQQQTVLRKLLFLERFGQRFWPILGGGYVMLARKRVTTLTPIRPRWQPRRKLVTTGLVEPMTPQRKTKMENS
jgi:SAM-dependent methyltransferase